MKNLSLAVFGKILPIVIITFTLLAMTAITAEAASTTGRHSNPNNSYGSRNRHTNYQPINRSIDPEIRSITKSSNSSDPFNLDILICMNGNNSLFDIGIGAFTLKWNTYNQSGQKSAINETSLGGCSLTSIKNAESGSSTSTNPLCNKQKRIHSTPLSQCILLKNFPGNNLLTATQKTEYRNNRKITFQIDPDNSLNDYNRNNNSQTYVGPTPPTPTRTNRSHHRRSN